MAVAQGYQAVWIEAHENKPLPLLLVPPLRSSLIKKGMIFSPAHGDTAFTVPLFDQFMRRTVPDGPRKAGK